MFIQKEKIWEKTKNRQKLNRQLLVIGYEERIEFLDSFPSLAADFLHYFQPLALSHSDLIFYTSLEEGCSEGLEMSIVKP